jgi:hypothetical protein
VGAREILYTLNGACNQGYVNPNAGTLISAEYALHLHEPLHLLDHLY